jgi:hypothetical protein
MLVGRQAGKVARIMQSMSVKIFTPAHPPPKVRNMSRAMPDPIPEQWVEAGQVDRSYASWESGPAGTEPAPVA